MHKLSLIGKELSILDESENKECRRIVYESVASLKPILEKFSFEAKNGTFKGDYICESVERFDDMTAGMGIGEKVICAANYEALLNAVISKTGVEHYRLPFANGRMISFAGEGLELKLLKEFDSMGSLREDMIQDCIAILNSADSYLNIAEGLFENFSKMHGQVVLPEKTSICFNTGSVLKRKARITHAMIKYVPELLPHYAEFLAVIHDKCFSIFEGILENGVFFDENHAGVFAAGYADSILVFEKDRKKPLEIYEAVHGLLKDKKQIELRIKDLRAAERKDQYPLN